MRTSRFCPVAPRHRPLQHHPLQLLHPRRPRQFQRRSRLLRAQVSAVGGRTLGMSVDRARVGQTTASGAESQSRSASGVEETGAVQIRQLYPLPRHLQQRRQSQRLRRSRSQRRRRKLSQRRRRSQRRSRSQRRRQKLRRSRRQRRRRKLKMLERQRRHHLRSAVGGRQTTAVELAKVMQIPTRGAVSRRRAACSALERGVEVVPRWLLTRCCIRSRRSCVTLQ